MTDWTISIPDDPQEPPEAPYGLPERSGGHTWHEAPHGRVCFACGRRWAEVVGATDEAVRKFGYAHVGALVEGEQQEFADEVDWLWSTIIDAASAGGGGSHE